MFSMLGQTGPPAKIARPHRPENVGQQRDFFCRVGSFYGVLRHLQVHMMQHKNFCDVGGSVRRIAKSEVYVRAPTFKQSLIGFKFGPEPPNVQCRL